VSARKDEDEAELEAANQTASRKAQFDKQVEILRLERELEKARNALGKQRADEYKGAVRPSFDAICRESERNRRRRCSDSQEESGATNSTAAGRGGSGVARGGVAAGPIVCVCVCDRERMFGHDIHHHSTSTEHADRRKSK
jgi:hypothetical protein